MKKILFNLSIILSSYSFSQTLVALDNLNFARTGHESIVLQNGKVLTFGGDNGDGLNLVVYNSCELYDPQTNTWTNTPNNMTIPRRELTSELLPDGKVLAIGGKTTGNNPVGSCEIYNPTTGIWSSVAPMNYPRWGHHSVTLQNGKILVAGGDYGSYNQNSAEIYDYATDTWTLTSDMIYEHDSWSSLVLLNDGKVLCTGGWGAYPDEKVAEIYDPQTDTWTAVGNMNYGRNGHSSVVLNNGKVLIYGGATASTNVELFDPNTNTFTSTGSLNQSRSLSPGVKLTDGKIFTYGLGTFLGGTSGTMCMEIYNPNSASWFAPTTFIFGSQNYKLVVINGNEIMTIGGLATSGNGADNRCFKVSGLTADVNEIKNEINYFNVFPNPSSEILNIEFNNQLNNVDFTIEIFTLDGRKILTKSNLKNISSSKVNVSELESGMYFVNIVSNNKILETKKIIIK